MRITVNIKGNFVSGFGEFKNKFRMFKWQIMFLMPDTVSVSLGNVANLLFVDRQYKQLLR